MPGGPFRLDGKIALVTGAGRGIGRACALALVEAGAKVIAVAQSEPELSSLKEEADGEVETWPADVRDDAFISRVHAMDRLDVLVNNAGTNKLQPVLEVDDETLDVLIALNVRAAFKVAQAAAAAMVRAGQGGSIINMSSQMGHVGGPKRTVYCLTKHAIEGMTKAMAIDLARDRVRVNSVAPTVVETPMTAPFFEDPAYRQSVLAMIPLGIIAQPRDVASAVVYLASSSAGMVTGTSLKVDGGATAQ